MCLCKIELFEIELFLHLTEKTKKNVLILNWIVRKRTVYINKIDLALHWLQLFIWHKTKPSKTKQQNGKCCVVTNDCNWVMGYSRMKRKKHNSSLALKHRLFSLFGLGDHGSRWQWNNGHKRRGNFFVLAEPGTSCTFDSFLVLALQSPIESESKNPIVFYCGSQDSLPLLLLLVADIVRPAPATLVVCESPRLILVLLSPTPLEEMLNSVNLIYFLITYLFVPQHHC